VNALATITAPVLKEDTQYNDLYNARQQLSLLLYKITNTTPYLLQYDIYGAVVMAQSHCKSSSGEYRFECQVAANPQTKPTDFGYKSANNCIPCNSSSHYHLFFNVCFPSKDRLAGTNLVLFLHLLKRRASGNE